MVLMTLRTHIWLFFLYGLAFFTLGTSALQHRLRQNSEFPLMRSIFLLGHFGILHGISKWITMLRLTGAYADLNQMFYLVEVFVSALSFAFLLSFGLAMIVPEKVKHLNLYIWIPWMVFILWTFFYLGRYSSAPINHYDHITLFSQLSRYLLGFPGAAVAGVAFFFNSRQMKLMKLPQYARLYLGAGILLMVYGISAGLLNSPIDTMPEAVSLLASGETLSGQVPIELFRAGSAIGITVLTVRLFDSFLWENQKRLNEYAQQQLVLQERKKTVRMVHDHIIQRLFGAGMFVENMLGNDKLVKKENLVFLKEELNETIQEAREFLNSFSEKSLLMEDFHENLESLVDRFRLSSNIQLMFDYRVPPMVLGRLSAEKNTQLYFIIQEALMNIQKHAHANKAIVRVTSTLQELSIQVIDDGIGFQDNADPFRGYGIQSMKERAESIGATLFIEQKNNHTYVTIMVPWEERENER